MLVILVVGGVVMLWLPTEDIRIGALAAGATQAVRDLNETYKTALGGQPAYHGYVIDGAFDFHAVKSRMGDVAVPVLSMDQVRPCDWRKERGVVQGFGPQYIYLVKKTDKQALVVKLELIQCTRLWADVKISHSVGGVTYRLSRGPAGPWKVTGKKDEHQIVY